MQKGLLSLIISLVFFVPSKWGQDVFANRDFEKTDSLNVEHSPYGDPEFYLIDSLDVSDLSSIDQVLLDTSLSKYHSAKHDTDRINALYDICEHMVHEDWYRYQIMQLTLIKRTMESDYPKAAFNRLQRSLANALNNIALVHLAKGEIDKSLEYHNSCLIIRKAISDRSGLAESYNNIGMISYNKGEIKEALRYYKKALSIYREIKEGDGVAICINNIGLIYSNYGNARGALTYYFDGLKLAEEFGLQKLKATTLNNIASIYSDQGDLTKAFSYNKKSLKVRQEIGDKKGIANTYANIGVDELKRGNEKIAIEYFGKALQIFEEIDFKRGVAKVINEMGTIYSESNDFELAKQCYNKSLSLYEEMEEKHGICKLLCDLGSLYLKQRKFKEAERYLKMSLKLGEELGTPQRISAAAERLSIIYEKKKENSKALEMYKTYVLMKDSVNNNKTQEASLRLHVKYEYAKQKAIDDAENRKKVAVEQEEKERQKIWTLISVTFLGVVMLLSLFVFNRLQVTKKQKLIIENQKAEVELSHGLLKEKNREITDSIVYARRIQSAILPSKEAVKKYLSKSFILYKPKDIVAGDFYWLEHKDDKVLFAVADCTGHGVPGAMVSVVCNNGLNRSVREHGLTNPGKILDKTREIVVKEFEKSEEEVMDGMDIALCAIEGRTLNYAGAHNPLWIIRRNEIIEIKADKQPIAKFDSPKPYTNHTIEMQEGDTVYLFSDGFADQFGGEKGKKFKLGALRELLLSIQDKTMKEQREKLIGVFESWKGNLEQVDDVCLIGVRI